MRKLLIRLFVGYYELKFGNIPRVSVIIMPLLVIPIVLDILYNKINNEWYLFIPFLLSILISFVYFRIFPVKTNELSKKQMKQLKYKGF